MEIDFEGTWQDLQGELVRLSRVDLLEELLRRASRLYEVLAKAVPDGEEFEDAFVLRAGLGALVQQLVEDADRTSRILDAAYEGQTPQS